MRTSIRSYVTYSAFVVMVSVFAITEAHPRAAGRQLDWCDAPYVCDRSVSCDQECLSPSGPLETTCGEFDGGFWSGYCGGVCGDYVCVPEIGETSGNCSDDCGYIISPPTCGDSTCEVGETVLRCLECMGSSTPDVCGDGVCDNSEGGDVCPKDCTVPGDICNENNACPSGWTCNSSKICVWDLGPIYVSCDLICRDSPNPNLICDYQGAEACRADQICAPLAGYSHICQPRWKP